MQIAAFQITTIKTGCLLILCRWEVGEYDQWGDEEAVDTDDVELGLPFEDQIDRVLILQVIWKIPFGDHLPNAQ